MANENDKTVRMTTVLPKALHDRIKALAKADGRMTMPYVVRALEAHADKAERK